MRTFFRFVFGSCLVLGCGDSMFSSADAGTGNDGGSDASVSDANADATSPVVDAGVEAGCVGTWCACHAPKPTFCDDFDSPGEVAGQGWNDDAGHVNDPGSTLILTTTMPASPPKSLQVYVTGARSAVLTEDVASLASALVAFDVYVPRSTCAGTPAGTELARVVSGNTFAASAPTYLALERSATSDVVVTSTLGFGARGSISPLKADQWVRVRIRVRIGATLNWSVSYAAAGADDTPASAGEDAGAGALPNPNGPDGGPGWVSLGAWNPSAMATSDCAPMFDNVAIYETP